MNSTEREAMEAELRELARLSPMEYDTVREEKAEQLAVRVGTLDKEVAKRRETESEDSSCAVVEELSPWDEPVNGDALLAELYAVIERHVILPEGAGTALALWSMGTFCMDAWRLYPKCQPTSPEKRCGKSTLLECLEGLLYRPLLASNISAAALFRCIQEWQPTLLIDEADCFVNDNEELNGLINAGHTRRTAFVLRVEKINDKHVPQKFSVWGAQVLAGIGKQRDTLMDRSIIIEMRRKAPGESCTRLPIDHFERCQPLRRRCLRWATDNIEALKSATPKVPTCGNDRAEDNWRPLFAIASQAGGRWPAEVQAAYRALNESREDDTTAGTLLLADIRQVFDDDIAERVFSSRLIDRLAAMEERPWSEWKRGKPLTQNSLARLLSPYKIKSGTVRIGTGTGKGYKREQFSEAWERYLPSQNTPLQTVTTSQPSAGAAFSGFETVTSDDDVTLPNRRKPSAGAACDVVTVQNGGNGNRGGDSCPAELFDAAATACAGLKLTPGRFLAELDAEGQQEIMADPQVARAFAVSLDARVA